MEQPIFSAIGYSYMYAVGMCGLYVQQSNAILRFSPVELADTAAGVS